MAKFEPALAKLLRWEGGYVNDPQDPGGETNFGITQRSLDSFLKTWPDSAYPKSVKDLTRDQAASWYSWNYWAPMKLSSITSQEVASALFSFAVNQGAIHAVGRLQALLGVKADGHCGPVTIAAINAADPVKLTNDFCHETLKFYRGLAAARPSMGKFLAGWENRVGSYIAVEGKA